MRIGLYVLGTVAAFGLLGLAAVLSPLPFPLTLMLLQCVLLLLGWLYAAQLPAWLGWPAAGQRWQGAGILALSAGLGVAAMLALHWVPRVEPRFPPSSFVPAVLLFLLPHFFLAAWQAWQTIPPKQYKLWQVQQLAPAPNLGGIDLSHFMVVHFWMARHHQDPAYHDFTSKAPYQMRLGDLFSIFLTDYNRLKPDQALQYVDAQGTPYGWLFYAKRAWWRRRQYYDPEVTFQNNLLRQGDIIVAERVPLIRQAVPA
ncbi:TssN family type VI secretion system protein [Hymenobacter sp. 15J16-1T3B]|uniref:TssN family type VI secretion system protein n=1 Tax=Hymenobacter sp. 15J16-1T3B TaxID=2886941 RepID=UPI001D12AAE9|nr:TssN family type VI secretion system protein [Hymenobacter sp. 15J16-1T3B]MCC3158609.1 TssN family type VI secretion system protein [Hymenobacter sp. 15J16-1T3B]